MKQWLLLLCLLTSACAQHAYQTPGGPMMGSAWYPEQWPETRWDDDLTLMEQAHMNVVRVGEFAWSSMEPAEGQYQLDWLERAVALAAKHHLRVVMSTPTDAPPAWLTRKYPDTLGTNPDGHLREHGGRRQFNYANPHYRQLCAQLVARLGHRFGHNAAVIGWQIGNEYTDESFDSDTRKQFQDFLRARYGTLAELNARWSTAYWSQTYDDWREIPLPIGGGNPGLLLEHKHFVTATWRSFQKNQIDVLRPLIDKAQFLTTNIGGLAWSDHWDHYAIAADLDLASWDDYVGQGHLDVAKNAMLNDFVRGWKRGNFWVMETQPGSVNWAPVNNALAPGETRALAWQAIGHGADAVLYWQWRAALNGQESYHGAIVGPDGQPLPIYAELARLGDDLVKTRSVLEGTSPQADVALLTSYDSRWAIDFQPHTKDYDQQQVLLRFYKPLAGAGRTVDVVDADADLSGYRLVIAPGLNVISGALAKRLLAYVQGGGHLLLGPRSGMKDEYDALNPQLQPGPLAEALGARVRQFYALDTPVTLATNDGRLQVPGGQHADLWGEDLEPTSKETHVDMTYGPESGWLAGEAALVTRHVGTGTLSLLGTVPDEPTMQTVMRKMTHISDTWSGSVGQVPDGVEVCVRRLQRRLVFIVINHGAQQADVILYGSLRNLLPDIHTEPARLPTLVPSTLVRLPPQAVAVLIGERP